jgi:hypothetical protein
MRRGRRLRASPGKASSAADIELMVQGERDAEDGQAVPQG